MSREDVTARTGSLRAAAARIGVSLPTLYKLIDSGKLRSYHIGRAHRVSDDAIRDCVALLESESGEGCASPRGKSQ
jgi:excisionase family DNA binding protein